MDGSIVAAAPLLEVQDLSVQFVSRDATVNAVSGAVSAGGTLTLNQTASGGSGGYSIGGTVSGLSATGLRGDMALLAR